MADKYTISIDSGRNLVRIVLHGFLDVADVAAFAQAQAQAYTALPTPGRHLTLVDVSGCKIQQQGVVEAFRKLLNDPRLMSNRIAFVTGCSPARMQIRRLISRDTARFFDDAATAEAWLAHGFVEAPRRVAAMGGR